MSSAQKIAVSLLISVLMFAVCAVAAFAGLFSVVETRFYQPYVIKTIEQRLNTIAAKEMEYSDILIQRFSTYVSHAAVASYASVQPSAEHEKTRIEVTARLFEETLALRGIRLIDMNGRNVHFSSFSQDVKARTATQVAYKNYADLQDIPFSLIACADMRSGTHAYTVFRDQTGNRIIYSFPFYDTYGVYRGTMAFYCDPNDFNRFLLSQNQTALDDSAVLVSVSATDEEKTPGAGGYVFGLPVVGRDVLVSVLLEQLAQPNFDGMGILASAEKTNWVVLAKKTKDNGFVARTITDDMLGFSSAVRVLLLIIMFITLFLVVFLVFSVRHDDMVVIKDRVRRFQHAFIEEYLNKQAAGEHYALSSAIAARKAGLNQDIKRSLGRRAKRHEKEVDKLLERSWNEILGAVGQPPVPSISAPTPDTAELKRMLEEVLSTSTLHLQAVSPTLAPASDSSVVPIPAKGGGAEHLESTAELEAAEPVEDLEEVEAVEAVEELADAEEVEAVEELTDAEEVEAVEELADAEEVEAVEELADAEEVEAVEELVDAEEPEAVEELVDAEEPEAVEELTDAEDIEPIEELVEAEATEAVAELTELAPSDAVETALPVEEVDAVESLESIDEPEALEMADDFAEAEPEAVARAEENPDTATVLTRSATDAFLAQMRKAPPAEFIDLKDIVSVKPEHVDADDFIETIGFSSPTHIYGLNNDFIADTFNVEPLDFSDLDKLDTMEFDSKGDEQETVTPILPRVEQSELPPPILEEVPSLEAAEEKTGFSFWDFGRNDTPATELALATEEIAPPAENVTVPFSEQVIVESDDGTYRIAEQLPVQDARLDMRFKALVDSVLQ